MNTQKIGLPENLKLKETIILNGKIGYCRTCDENGETIGVKSIHKVKRFNGDVVETVIGEFPFTKEIYNLSAYGKVNL